MGPLRLYLSPIDASRFKAIVTDSPFGEGETESVLPFTDRPDGRIIILKTLEAGRFQAKDFPQDGEQEWMVQVGLLADKRDVFHPNMYANIGQVLYQSLFPVGSKVEKLLQEAIRLNEREGTQLHLQIKIEADAVQRSRLSDYTWELLHDGQGFLAQRQVSFSRYIAYNAARPNLPPVEQVNVLLVSSAASDRDNGLEPLSKLEQQAVYRGLEKAQQEGQIRLAEPERATLAALRVFITEHQGDQPPHILHFDGHGLFGKRCNSMLPSNRQCRTIHPGVKAVECKSCRAPLPVDSQGYLVFETDEGGADYVSAEELGSLLHQASLSDAAGGPRGVALVVLSACQSGLSLGGGSVFNGVAQSLIGHRVPAVMAMQYSVSVASATAFAEQFYRSLGKHEPVARAVSQGREAMGAEGNQWYRPVLYLRWQDNEGGQLFAAPQSDVSPEWLKLHSQYLEEDFVHHMRGGEKLTARQATGHYLELLVRKRSMPGEQEPAASPLDSFVEQRNARLLVFSEGGGGKTISLLKLAVDAARRAVTDPTAPIPIYVRLNAFDTKDRGSDELLEMVCDATRLQKEEVQDLLNKGRRPFLFLLDGFNEVRHEFQEACALSLQEFIRRGLHRYVITSRPGGWAEKLAMQVSEISALEIVQLDEAQIREFLARHGAAGVYERLGEQLKGLARSPFMLWALAQSCVGLPGGDLPRNGGQLYQNFIDHYIFDKREQEKVPPPTEYNYLLVKKPILAELAIEMTREAVTRRKEDRQLLQAVSAQLKAIRAENEGLVEIKPYELLPDPPVAKGLLDEAVNNGVLRRVGDTLEFMHQSVQDYFTAVALFAALAQSGCTTTEIVELSPPIKWQSINLNHPEGVFHRTEYARGPYYESTAMLSGMLPDSSDLVKRLNARDPLVAARCCGGAALVRSDVRDELRVEWLALLGRWHERYRWVACQCFAAAQLKEEEVLDRLNQVAGQDSATNVRSAAIEALGILAPETSVNDLIKAWAEPAVWELLNLFGQKVTYDPETKEEIETTQSVHSALESIQNDLDKWPLTRLIEASLSDSDEAVRQAAAIIVRSLRTDSAIVQLIDMLQAAKTDSQSRIIAAAGLGLMEAEGAVDLLLGELRDDDTNVRIAAATALIHIKDETAIPPLIQTLIELATKDDKVSSREVAAKLLNDVPGGRDALYAPILEALGSEEYAEAVKLIGEGPFLPANPNLYSWRSIAYCGLGRLEEALADCDWFIRYAPQPGAADHFRHAMLLSDLNRHQEALAAARKAAELDLDQAISQINLGWYAYKAGEYEEGITASQLALELDPQQPMAAFNLGLMLSASGQINDAKNAYLQGVAICEGVDKEIARADLKGAMGDLEELAQAKSEVASAVEGFKRLLKTAHQRYRKRTR